MSTQNGLHLEISWKWNFDSHREAMHLQCVPPMRYVMGGAKRAHKRDDLFQICAKLAADREYALLRT
jgi:hypothetical protein